MIQPSIANMPLVWGSHHNAPTRIILHSMGEYIDTDADDYHARDFLDKLGLSAHALVTPSGVLIRCREYDQGAYHAKHNNTNTLGMEFLVPGLHDYGSFLQAIKKEYLSESQFQAGVWEVVQWIKRGGMSIDAIVTHHQIDRERKFDPGEGFPLEDFVGEVKKNL